MHNLKSLDHWVCLRNELDPDGKNHLVAYNPTTNSPAVVDDPSTWTNFDTASLASQNNDFDGIAFMLHDTNFVGIELRNCIKDSLPSSNAQTLVNRLNTYTEFSLFNNGLMLILEANMKLNFNLGNFFFYGRDFIPISLKPWKEELPIKQGGFTLASTISELKKANNPFKKIKFYTPRDFLEKGKFDQNSTFFRNFINRKTGFKNIDENFTLFPGLYVIGAISSLGKTTFCTQMAEQLSMAGHYVLYFSYEQSEFELISKGIARQAARSTYLSDFAKLKTCTDAATIRLGNLSPEMAKTADIYKETSKNLYIRQCKFQTSIVEIEREILNFMALHPFDSPPIVFIDYLQLIKGEEQANASRQNIDYVVSRLKQLTKDPARALTVIIISSFNRSSYSSRVSHKSFKESGGIEYTADVVWGLNLAIIEDLPKLKSKINVESIAKSAMRLIPREIKLVTLKNRYGSLANDFYFSYYPNCDLFVEADKFEFSYNTNVEEYNEDEEDEDED